MLALGTEKKELARQLAKELAAVAGTYMTAGMTLAVPVSYLIWKFFQLLVVNTAQTQYRPGAAGILAGLCFAAVLSLGILVLGVCFIRRTDIMDILNAGRKTEMVRVIRPYTGKLGMALVAAGLFLAMAVPQMTVRLFRQGMPGIWNVTYLIAAAGLYLLMLSAVARSGKGRHPETYYKHIISTNLMRFSARQTTRNLCVIAMLVFVMVLSAFWGVMYYFSVTEGGSEALYDYSIHYPAEEEQIGGEDVRRLAREYGVEITAYEELETLELVIRYTGRDMDDSGRYFDVEYEKLASFLPESDFTRISGIPMDLGEGEYRSVTIAMDNRQLFEDLKKLGADDAYEERVIRVQLQKIFAWPVAAGCVAAGLFSLFLTYFNDMVLKPFEVRMLLMEMLLMALIASVLYGVYRAAYRRTKEIAGI